MGWKTIASYTLAAVLTFLLYFVGSWRMGYVVDEDGRINKGNLKVHFLILILALAGATILASKDLEAIRKQAEEEAKSKYAGVLKAESKVLLPFEQPIITKLEIGWTLNKPGAIIQYPGGPLSNVFKDSKGNVPKAFEDICLTIREKDEEVKVSTLIRDQNGTIVAVLTDNEWKVSPPPVTFDRNYTKDMLEVIDGKGNVVLQVRVLKDRIQLNGVFYDSHGNGIVIFPPEESDRGTKFPKDEHVGVIQLLPQNRAYTGKSIKPIFKYPSDLHLGELE